MVYDIIKDRRIFESVTMNNPNSKREAAKIVKNSLDFENYEVYGSEETWLVECKNTGRVLALIQPGAN